jgi:hypothetical protein
VIYPGSPPAAGGASRAARGDGIAGVADAPGDDAPRGERRPVVVGPSEQRRPGNGNGSGDGRRRWLLLGGGAVVIALVAVGALVLGGGDGEGPTGPQFHESTDVDIELAGTAVEAVGFPVDFPADVKDQVFDDFLSYVDQGIATPLREGKAKEAELTALFDQAAAARLAGAERSVLVDEGFPKVVGEIKIDAEPGKVGLTGLMDRDGKVVVVSATFDLKISAQAEKGKIAIHRAGSIDFASDASGAWKITGWSVSVDRSGPGVTPSTTTPPTTSAA